MLGNKRESWTDQAAAKQGNVWVAHLGILGHGMSGMARSYETAVNEIESCGWRLEQMVPTFTNGATEMFATFRRVGS